MKLKEKLFKFKKKINFSKVPSTRQHIASAKCWCEPEIIKQGEEIIYVHRTLQ